MNVPSLTNPPAAPKAKRKPLPTLGSVRPLSFPSTPPPPAPKKAKPPKRERNLTPIPLHWGLSGWMREARFLTERGDVRQKFLTHSLEDIEEETDVAVLNNMWELFFPASQPHNAYEEAYLLLMRDAIDIRLAELAL